MKNLTTVSYALLGFLARRPSSAYDMTKTMQTSGVRYLWPRAASRIYLEPANLVDHGLAIASEQLSGRRRRTVYAITANGRAALREWLTAPGDRPKTEHEALLKVFYSEFGTIEQLRSQLQSMRLQIESEYSAVLEILDRVTENGHPDESRAHLTRLILEQVLLELDARSQWILAAEQTTLGWQTTQATEASTKSANEWFSIARQRTLASFESFTDSSD